MNYKLIWDSGYDLKYKRIMGLNGPMSRKLTILQRLWKRYESRAGK